MTSAELQQLAQLLVQLGCPPDKTPEMAVQLDKRAAQRAAQLAAAKGRTHEEALAHLLTLLKQARQ